MRRDSVPRGTAPAAVGTARKIARQQHHIIAALTAAAQTGKTLRRWNRSARNALQHLAAQVTVGRRQHPHVHAQATIVADALNIAILQREVA